MADKKKDNHVRMPFATWVNHMREDGLSYPARWLAVNLAVFRTTSNAELELLSDVDGHTYKKYKSELLKAKYVVLARAERKKGGRGIGFEPLPAYQETPVIFTDLIPRNGGKYYPGNEVAENEEKGGKNNPGNEGVVTPVIPAPVSAETQANSAQVSKEVSPHTPLQEKITTTLTKQGVIITTGESKSARDDDDGALAGLNGCAVEIIDFIAKHARVEQPVARQMLMTNVHTYSAPAVLDAFSATIADMVDRGKIIPNPYKYLIGCAIKARDRLLKRGASARPGAPGRKSMSEIIREEAEKLRAKEQQEKRP